MTEGSDFEITGRDLRVGMGVGGWDMEWTVTHKLSGTSLSYRTHGHSPERRRARSEALALLTMFVDTHYPREDVMPDATQSPPTGHDIGPGDQAVADAKDYAALRQDIRNMVELYEIYGEEVSLAVDPESATVALSYLDTYEGRNWPSPRILVEDNSIVLTWEIGNWKLYQYCDDELQRIFHWDGTPPARDASNEG
jgi:hypothetical protein